ncbi:hypothetical protein M5K25_018913 [Dendrobium thyrsiflorum]|uniref:Uncharacterized protein n=1 Tax=Dendrobium thyrsiflorum TaxID=117978 RepID=A0ABD0UKG5_DENTH
MEAEQEGGGKVGDERVGNTPAVWKEKMVREWQKIREHAETYPYVWGSYIVVYGSFGVYLTYRWRKLRRTEGRVRILQERLRKLVEEEEAATASSGSGPAIKPPSAPPKSVATPTKVLPNAKKIRYCSIDPEHEDKLDMMFMGVVATGAHAWTPNQAIEHPDVGGYSEQFDNVIYSSESPLKKTDDLSDSNHSKRKSTSTSKTHEWWKDKLQVLPNAKKIRYCSIDPELEDKLDMMFMGVVATGAHAWTPNQAVEHPDVGGYSEQFDNRAHLTKGRKMENNNCFVFDIPDIFHETSKPVHLRILDCKPAIKLLDKLKPLYLFSAHLQSIFPTIIQHGKNGAIPKFCSFIK